MKIGEMFDKPINREINGVIKVGQKDEENIFQELNEYVVTDELRKHFKEFFSVYNYSLNNPTDNIGVWITGFFGSGKSHFLKILSYILDSNLKVENMDNPEEIRRPIDFFKEDKKIEDPMVIADMINASNVSTDVILFNIDSKSSNSESEKDKILDVFLKVFNEMRGYCTEYPFLADFEKKLEQEHLYEEFKTTFKSINGDEWEEIRDDYYYISDDIVETIVKIGFMSEDAANNWADKAEENYSMSIEKFAREVNNYCNSKGKNHHVIFLVDEVGQYIGEDTKLMLNLQSITEDLGSKCKGKAWVVVTSQESIDDIVEVKGKDLDKIQGRFKTRLSLTSSSVDEVIRKRILTKKEPVYKSLIAKYPQYEYPLKDAFIFTDSANMGHYINADDFAAIYPFVPYQFNLLQAVLTAIREHGASGKHLGEGERSMLAVFQDSGKALMDKEEGSLAPFNVFYDPLAKFIDHSHSSVIIKAAKNPELKPFDVEVLKVLFLIKYVKEVEANLNNIAVLMISEINQDMTTLKDDIKDSLERLEHQTLILKNGETYSFLTNEEQDVNKEIKHENVDEGEVLSEASKMIFYDIYGDKKYMYTNKYNFSFNKAIDNSNDGMHKNDIGIRVISPFYEFNHEVSEQSTLSTVSEEDKNQNSLKALSEKNNEVIIYLNEEFDIFKEIREILQIERYLKKNSIEMDPTIKANKQEELKQKKKRVSVLLQKSLKHVDIFVNGSKADIGEKNPKERIEDALEMLVKKVYHKLSYMDFSPDEADILEAISESSQEILSSGQTEAHNALDDADIYIKRQSDKFIKPSLKTIFGRFTSAPYGFNDVDVQWIIAKLFSQNRITLLLNSEPISLKNYKSEEILNFLSAKEYKDKILVEKKKETPKKKIKITKQVFKDIFGDIVNSDNDEVIMDKFISESNKKLTEINDCLSYYRTTINYPGQNVLINAQELLMNVVSKKSTEQFYNYIFDNEDDLLDMGDETFPVIQFFNTNQKQYFDEAFEVHNIFESNKNYIDDVDLINIADDIEKILIMEKPYSKIPDLPNLTDAFLEKHKVIIDKEKLTPQNDIKLEFEEVSDVLNMDYEYKDELKEKYQQTFENDFDSLTNKLNNTNDIATIRGISDQASILKNKCVDKINEFKESKTGDGDETSGPKSVDISVKFITSQSKVKIKNEADLDMFLNKIKSEVIKQLEENDIVNLKL